MDSPAVNCVAPGGANTLLALTFALLASTLPARALDTAYERLANPEPQNWLMHHHDYSGQRFSVLDAIDRTNVKNLRLLFAVALGGTSKDDSLEATPLVEDGFMYVADSSGIVSKIDVRSGNSGRILWRMNPNQAKPDRDRGVALWNDLVVSVTGYDGRVIATDKETGRIVWEKNLLLPQEVGLTELTAAPLALRDAVLVASSGGDHGTRSWLAALDPRTGNMLWKTYSVPAPGEPGSETWKDNHGAWQTGGGAFYGTGTFDPSTNLTYWGSGNPVPGFDPSYRPGDNLYTNSAIAFDAASGQIKWYHQYTPNDSHDYDETGSHVLIDVKVNGEDRKILAHPARNGFAYTFDRINGQFAVQTVRQVTWTKGIDPKTGKPVDAEYPGLRRPCQCDAGQGGAPGVPDDCGRHQFLAVILQPQDRHALFFDPGRLQAAHPRYVRPRDRALYRRRGRRERRYHGQPAGDRPILGRGEKARGPALSGCGRRPHDSRRHCGDGDDRRHRPGL
jgi:alcohol dehydrogenase (cytochrome c)